MAESLGSDLESDASSVDGGPTSMAWSQTSTAAREQLVKRMESLQQENRVLRMELDTFRYKCKSLEEENRELKKARVTIVSIE
jgi:coiled-coil domain-containing protein 6